MAELVNNFGLVTVSGTYNAAATSITLQTGHGSRLPSTAGGFRYRLTWWDATTYSHPADDPFKEIVLVTNRTGDVLTVVRGQENIAASIKNVNGVTYRMSLGVTAEMFDGLRVMKNTHQGLALQTDRDATDALKKVELTACEYLVMDDGTVLRNDNGEWTGKTADITIAGAGGLDAGTEESGFWYEIYAVAKEDGTRNLMLRKATGWFTTTNWFVGEDASQAVRSATSNAFVGQGFQAANSGRVIYADVRVKKVGSPTGNIVAALYANNAGIPGSALATSHAIDVSNIPTTACDVRFTFPDTAPVLSPSPTVYHVVLGGDWTINGADYIEWRMDGSAGSYPSGSKSVWNGTTWTADADDDMMFAIGLESNANELSRPADYTKQCFLGWVFNDGNGHFVPFLQHGRRRRTTSLLASHCSAGALNGSQQILGLQTLLPPLEVCTVLMGVGGTGTQAGLVAVGDVSRPDVSSSGDSTGAQALLYSGMTSTRPGGFTEVLVRRNACMVQGTNGAKVWVSGFSW